MMSAAETTRRVDACIDAEPARAVVHCTTCGMPGSLLDAGQVTHPGRTWRCRTRGSLALLALPEGGTEAIVSQLEHKQMWDAVTSMHATMNEEAHR